MDLNEILTKERDSLRDENIELRNKIKELELKLELDKKDKEITSESNDTTDDEVLDAFNKIKSGEASRMGQKNQMKTVTVIVIIVGISLGIVFVTGEIVWYFAGQEFENVREEIKEDLLDVYPEPDCTEGIECEK